MFYLIINDAKDTVLYSLLLSQKGFEMLLPKSEFNKLETENTGMRKKYVHANMLHSGWSQVPSAFDAAPGPHSSLNALDAGPHVLLLLF